jgi:hypothetical protein
LTAQRRAASGRGGNVGRLWRGFGPARHRLERALIRAPLHVQHRRIDRSHPVQRA